MKSGTEAWLEHTYIWTLGLLLVHQVDSGYWHEWTLFHLPGGIEGFLISNLVLVVPFLYGAVQVARAPRVGARFGLVLAAVGVAAFGIHSCFLLLGHPEFRSVTSVGVLTAALLSSLALGWASISTLRASQAG